MKISLEQRNKVISYSVCVMVPHSMFADFAVEVGLVRAGRLRRSVLWSAFEGRF